MTPQTSDQSATSHLRRIPSVEKVLSHGVVPELSSAHGRELVKAIVVSCLDGIRRAGTPPPDLEAIVADVSSRVASRTASPLRPVINATGVIIHTNLGRSPVGPELWAGAAEPVCDYSNLEFDLETGGRGHRDVHLTSAAADLFGCEAAVLTNNNAAATLLLLAAVAAGKEVVVSRGELVEIGGGFRVPDVIQQGGARLREVGTTNKTRVRDYVDATNESTAAWLRVHRSNFDIVGFTEEPDIAGLAAAAHERKRPLLYDEGSGRAIDLTRYGLATAPTIRELFEAGVDVITCSTDKLLGATQGGLILGRAEVVEKCRRHPLMRALRAGKESYAIVVSTLRTFAAGKQDDVIPIYRLMAAPVQRLRDRAEALATVAGGEVVQLQAAVGGGTTPTETIPSAGVALLGDADQIASRLLRAPVPVVGRIIDDRFTVDLRTVFEEQDEGLAETLKGMATL